MNRDTDIKGQAILFSEMTPPEGREDEFNLWYDEHHSPSHVKGVPGFKSALRYKSDAGPHYLAIYELTSPGALEHEEYKKFKPISFHKILKDNGYLMDVKSIYPVGFFSEKPFKHWRL